MGSSGPILAMKSTHNAASASLLFMDLSRHRDIRFYSSLQTDNSFVYNYKLSLDHVDQCRLQC